MTPADAPVFVLVHSPLVGAVTWAGVADELRRQGHDVVVPRLDNPAATPRGLFRHHADQVRHAVEAHSRTAPVVLVGHSGAGALLPAAGDTLVNEVLAYVFVDAGLPRDRASRLDDAPPEFEARVRELATEGAVPPWAAWWSEEVLAALIPDEEMRDRFAGELQPLPLQLFEEPISVPPAWPEAPCAYLLLSEAYEGAAAEARRRGWEVARLDAGHLHMLVEPGGVASGLVALTGQALGRRAAGAGLDARPELLSDPVAQRRRQVERWVDLGRRIGFLALAVAVTLFGVALYWDLPDVLVQLIIMSLVVACVTLLPAIVAGYGVAAAEREDRERRV